MSLKYLHSSISVFILSYFTVNNRLGLYFQGYLQPRGFLDKNKKIIFDLAGVASLNKND